MPGTVIRFVKELLLNLNSSLTAVSVSKELLILPYLGLLNLNGLNGRKIDIVIANNGEVDNKVKKKYLDTEGKTIVQIEGINDEETEVIADNAPEGEYHEKITLYANTAEKPGTKKMLEELYETEAKTDLPENLPRDYDFVIVLGGEENSTENN